MLLKVNGEEGVCTIENVKAILFDLDGTLINTLDLHIEAFQWILRKLGKNVTKSELEGMMGRTPHDIIKTFMSDISPEDAWKAATEKEGYLETLIKEVRPFPGVENLLDLLEQKGVTRVVISSTYRELVKTLLRNAGLLKNVDYIVSGEDITKGKPDPEPFKKGLAITGLKETEVVGIGDSIHDALSCTGAGIRFIGVLTGKTDIRAFKDIGIDCVITTFQHLEII
ncbi:MAG: HAD family phosphatase [Methanobacteriota archaeon]|nr:MAG: HAD family phosphatase [Euryarchaeota archaeon]